MDKNGYESALKFTRDIIDFFNYLVEQHGEVKFIKYGNNRSNEEKYIYHDFIYYCFTKSIRSLYASIDLAEKYYREDCLIILRTVYENYLHIAHVLKEPEMIREYVEQTIGLEFGKYSYKIKENKRKNYNVVIDLNTEKEYPHGTSNGKRVKCSINKFDIKVHKIIYKYLSEHIHPNMLGSGNYRNKDDEHYLVESYALYLEVNFFLLYLCYILADAIYYYHIEYSEWNIETITDEELMEYELIIKKLRKKLLELLEECKVEDNIRNVFTIRIENLIK
ncbi:hypothetical protein DV092_10255 [Clostridium botulinum]|uniref:DUF5677 domain-containing protein n=1 Tax=Clostridium sp. ZBS20 TaxID=2949966 RepID=UPI00207B0965|nr:DUF5677 domain-containing protein [Clostridium sp. ZBS20]MBN1052414.1 hypothetical protein [Clostridium botulinum]